MRMRSRIWWCCVFLALAACAGPRERAVGSPTTKPGLMAERDDLTNGLQSNGQANPGFDDFGAQPAKGAVATLDDVTNQPVGKTPAERLLTYRGEIRVEVARPEDAVEKFLAVVKGWGGYLQSQVGTTLTVRVPASHFDEAFVLLRTYGRVLGEKRSADDVTEEFTDLGIRIDNARKSLDRLREVLQKADKVEDILRVEEQMRRLTEEIERMEGRRKLLADQVAMSTLQASFQAVAEAPPMKRSRQMSRFAWINAIGAERVMEDF